MVKAFDLMDTAKTIRLGVPEFGYGQTHEKGMRTFPDFNAADWETSQIEGCLVQIFWLDFMIGDKADPESKPGFDTRFELGIALGQKSWVRKKLLVGIPEKPAETPQRLGLIRHHLQKSGVRVYKSMSEIASVATNIIYNGQW